MRYLLVFVPISLGLFDLFLRESSSIGWIFIGIGVFFLVAQTTGFLNPPKVGYIKFDWFSNFICICFATVSFVEFIENYQQSDLLRAIGFLLLGLSTIDVLLASIAKKKATLSIQEASEKISVRFQDAFKYLGLGFLLSSLVVGFW